MDATGGWQVVHIGSLGGDVPGD